MKKISWFTAGICSALMLFSSETPVRSACGQSSVTITDIPTLGGSSFAANAVNDVGQVVGFSLLPGDAVGHAFLYSSNSTSDLGTLGGNYSQAYAQNHSGQVVGEANTTGDQATHAFVVNGSVMTDLGTLGGAFSVAVAINDAGMIIGDSDTAFGNSEAFLYANGTMTNVGTLGGMFSSAAAINHSGMVVGTASKVGENEYHAFLRTNGTPVDLGTLGGGYSSAFGVNNNGAVAGESSLGNGELHGFVYSGGTMIDVGTLGGSFSSARGINDAGQAFGLANITNNTETHGFLFSGGVLTDLGTLGGGYSEVDAINNAGQAVGRSTTPTGAVHAFLWRNGTLTDLNSLLPTNSGWTLQEAMFINDAGRIVGYGDHGGFQWFVLDLASSDRPPVAVAVMGQAGDCQTPASLDGSGSSDPDGDSLTYMWTENGSVLGTNSVLTALLNPGAHTVTLTVADPCGQSSQTNLILAIVDTTAPSISGATASITISAGENCQAAVPNVLADLVVADNCTPANQLVMSQDPVAGTVVGDGSHMITVTVTDAAGNAATVRVTLNVTDTTAPVIVSRPEMFSISDCPPVIPDIRSEIVATDNCTPASQLTVTQSPAAGASPAEGNTITVTVTDASGNSVSASIPFTVSDKTAPAISSAPESVTISDRFGSVPNILPLIVASDNCTPTDQLVLKQYPAAGTVLNGDQRAIVVMVTDAVGNLTSLSIPLVFPDAVPPYIKRIAVNPSVLWPPNHKMVPVTVSVLALDNVDPAPASKIVSITANESVSPEEVQITGDLTAKLAAWRQGNGHGRIYTITVQCKDASGNTSACKVEVFVGQNASKKH